MNLEDVEQLSREQLKNVLGGFTGSGGSGSASCSCSLKSPTGQTLTLPSSTTSSWDTEAKCSNNCKAYCDGANSGGGDCASFSAVFASTGA